MSLVQTLKNKVPYIVTSFALLVAVVAPGVISTHAFAATVTERSIALSSSSAAASNVTYQIDFTTVSAAGAYSVTFCSNTPDVSVACVAPTGFDASGATSTGTVSGATNKIVVTNALSAGGTASDAISGITNPTASGPLYARVATYADAAAATADTVGTAGIDEGSVAISITNTIGVSGAVLESMTFCVAGQVITANCDLSGNTAPTLKLGETVGSVVALSSSAISTGTLYTQISTNAAGGAVVNLKSATACGGLKRADVSTCDIAPALATGISAGDAKFGLTIGTATNATGGTGGTARGTVAAAGSYDSSTYKLNYASDNTSGVTSPIGDPILNTAGAPANNKNIPVTFGVSVANNTPAGNYSTSLSMIATGKF